MMSPGTGHGPHHRTRDDGAVYQLGDRVKVKDQEIHDEIVRWDGGRAVVLDDDRDDWAEPDEEGVLVFSLWDLECDTESRHHPRHGLPPRPWSSENLSTDVK